jgi:hypothetical protein
MYIGGCFCSDHANFDTPYNCKVEGWDYLVTKKHMKEFLVAFAACNTADWCITSLWHDVYHSAVIKESLEEASYKSVHPFYWHKTGLIAPGNMQQYCFSVEVASVGYYPDRKSCNFALDDQCPKRHNFIETPAVRIKTKHAITGEIVNKHEKPFALTQMILQNHLTPSQWMMGLGCGIASDAIAAVKQNINFAGVENDSKQFDAIKTRLTKFKQDYTPTVVTKLATVESDEKTGKKPAAPANSNQSSDKPESESVPKVSAPKPSDSQKKPVVDPVQVVAPVKGGEKDNVSKAKKKTKKTSPPVMKWSASVKCPECKQRIKKSDSSINCHTHGVLVHMDCCVDALGQASDHPKFQKDDQNRWCSKECFVRV